MTTKGYVFDTYPTDNFGLATAYEGKVGVTKEICATWDCLGLSDQSQVDALSDKDKLYVVVNKIQYGEVGNGSGLKLTEDDTTSLR